MLRGIHLSDTTIDKCMEIIFIKVSYVRKSENFPGMGSMEGVLKWLSKFCLLMWVVYEDLYHEVIHVLSAVFCVSVFFGN